MHYHPDGQFRTAEILDQQYVAEHDRAAQLTWELSEDFTIWWNRHPQHHRSAHHRT